MDHNKSSADGLADGVIGPPPAAAADGAAKPGVEVKVRLKPVASPAVAADPVTKGYIDLLILLLTDRADRLGRRNGWILGLTAAIIAACIVIFWWSDSIVDLGRLDTIRKDNAAEREKLVKSREELTAQFGEADFKLAAIDTKEKAANVVLNYLSMVQVFSAKYRASGSYTKPDAVGDCRARIASLLNNPHPFAQALAVVQAIATPSPDGTNIDYENQKVTVPVELLKAMAGELVSNGGVRADSVAAGLKEIDERLRNVDAALARVDERATQQHLASLETLLAANYGGVKKAYDAYAEEKKKQGNLWQTSRLTNVRQELGRVDTQLAELDKQTAELQRKAYESVNSYGAWVPSLAVRVCDVILALFLTQFFMSIYRYNTMISTHYYSRADVLRMACTQGQADPVNADLFAKLAASMTIEKVDFILPENVIPKILEAAKVR